MEGLPDKLPLVSVIITTYNYAHFLSKAIKSVVNQTYKNFEIIVIDDGSEDDAASVVKSFECVQYYYQENKGLSAARNKGFKKSKGNYLVFLDADDWLEPDALQQNLSVIMNKPGVAFVSGNYYFLRAETNKLDGVCSYITRNHYTHLLRRNYIGMHAAVMFQRWVFKEFKYDEDLRACEDYDLYLHVARKYPVMHHQQFIATYYFHTSGLSHNYKAMMDSINIVMKKQASFIRTHEERLAYQEGLQQWKSYYGFMETTV